MVDDISEGGGCESKTPPPILKSMEDDKVIIKIGQKAMTKTNLEKFMKKCRRHSAKDSNKNLIPGFTIDGENHNQRTGIITLSFCRVLK